MEKPSHPDHALAAHLVAGFLDALPSLDHQLLAGLLKKGGIHDVQVADAVRLLLGTAEYPGETPILRTGADPAEALIRLMDSDAFRAALGRIASAYDGGHLIVIRGFEPDGDVILNDPAFRAERGEGSVWTQQELETVWFDHGGVAYIIRAPQN